jgi:hypothetical protein
MRASGQNQEDRLTVEAGRAEETIAWMSSSFI